MKAITKITILDDDGEKFFGEGPCRLFHLIDECGSLRAASIAMGMSYSKAFGIVKHAEKALCFPVTARRIGGKNGGGSELTENAREWLSRFEQYREDCRRMNEQLFEKHFASFRIGAVIMASGLGKRFGGNKLMADLNGRPLIGSVLDTVSGLFPYSAVVTRSGEVREYAASRGFQTVLHELPGRNDTVRLGIEQMPDMVQGCIFFQADQPFLKTKTVSELISLACAGPDRIIRCSHEGVPSSPVYFPRWAFDLLCSLPEGKGGSFLFSRYPDRITELTVDDPRELKDIDTAEDLLCAGRSPGLSEN